MVEVTAVAGSNRNRQHEQDSGKPKSVEVENLIEEVGRLPPVSEWLSQYEQQGEATKFCVLLIRVLEHDPAVGFALARAHPRFFKQPKNRAKFISLLSKSSYFYWKHFPQQVKQLKKELDKALAGAQVDATVSQHVADLGDPKLYLNPEKPVDTSNAIPYYAFATAQVEPTPLNNLWQKEFGDESDPNSLAARIRELDTHYAAYRTDIAHVQASVAEKRKLPSRKSVQAIYDPVKTAEEAFQEFTDLIMSSSGATRISKVWKLAEQKGQPYSVADKQQQLRFAEAGIRRQLEAASKALLAELALELKPGERIVRPGEIIIPHPDKRLRVVNDTGRTVIVDRAGSIVELEPQTKQSTVIQSIAPLRENLPPEAENIIEIDVTPRGPIYIFRTPNGERFVCVEGHVQRIHSNAVLTKDSVKVKTKHHTVIVPPSQTSPNQLIIVSNEGLRSTQVPEGELRSKTDGENWVGWFADPYGELVKSELIINGDWYTLPEFADFSGKYFTAEFSGSIAFVTQGSKQAEPDVVCAIDLVSQEVIQIRQRELSENWEYVRLDGVPYVIRTNTNSKKVIEDLKSGRALPIPDFPRDENGFYVSGTVGKAVDAMTGYETVYFTGNYPDRIWYLLRNGEMVKVEKSHVITIPSAFFGDGQIYNNGAEYDAINAYFSLQKSGSFAKLQFPRTHPLSAQDITVYNPSGKYIAVGTRFTQQHTWEYHLVTRQSKDEYTELRLPDWGEPIFTAHTSEGLFCAQQKGDEVWYWHSEQVEPDLEPKLLFVSNQSRAKTRSSFFIGFKNGLPVVLNVFPFQILHGKTNILPQLESEGFNFSSTSTFDLKWYEGTSKRKLPWMNNLGWNAVFISDLSNEQLRAVIGVDGCTDADLSRKNGIYSRLRTHTRDDRLRALNKAERLLALDQWLALGSSPRKKEYLAYYEGVAEAVFALRMQGQDTNYQQATGKNIALLNRIEAVTPLLWLTSRAPDHDYEMGTDWMAQQMLEAFFPNEFGSQEGFLARVRTSFSDMGFFGRGDQKEADDSADLEQESATGMFDAQWSGLQGVSEAQLRGGDPLLGREYAMAAPGTLIGRVTNVTASGVMCGTLSVLPNGKWKHVVVADQERRLLQEKQPSIYAIAIDYQYQSFRLPCLPDGVVNQDDVWFIVDGQRIKAETRILQGYVVVDVLPGTQALEYSDIKVAQKVQSFSWKTHQGFLRRFEQAQQELYTDLTAQEIQVPSVIIRMAEKLRTRIDSPLEFLQALEELVRQIGIYDFKNGEVVAERSQLKPQELVESWATRAAVIKNRSPEKKGFRLFGSSDMDTAYMDKLVAGVCYDANVLLVGLLRHFGFIAGLNDVYRFRHQRGESATFDKEMAHSSTFVLIPSSEPPGYTKLDLDGTYTTSYGKGEMPSIFPPFRERIERGEVHVSEEEVREADLVLEYDDVGLDFDDESSSLGQTVQRAFVGERRDEGRYSPQRQDLLNMVESNQLTALEARELRDICWFLVMELQGGDPEPAFQNFEAQLRNPYVAVGDEKLKNLRAMDGVDYTEMFRLLQRLDTELVAKVYEIVKRVAGSGRR